MSFYLKSKKLDFSAGGEIVAVVNEEEAESLGIQAGDRIELKWNNKQKIVVWADTSRSRVKAGQIGLFREVWRRHDSTDGDIVEVAIISRPPSIQAIKRKMLGKSLSYDEIYSIISDITENRLSAVEITYFVSSSFVKPYSNEELFYLSKSMAETGEKMNMPIKVVDKHSVGGLPGNRTTMVVVPIIASLGLYIPKTSSRAITSPAGTADTMEVLAPVSFSMKDIKKIVRKTKACLVWGGGLNIAPADDKVIQISRPLALEPYDKMLVSIMAKKIAMGVDYLVIDMPIGETTKIPNRRVANMLEKKFVWLGKKFNMKIKVIKTLAREPVGRGIGPALEARDVLRVLQQHKLRPHDLEHKSVYLAGELLQLKGYCRKGQGRKIAHKQLQSGAAWKKMQEIIKAQGGNSNINSEEVATGAWHYEIHAKKSGRISLIHDRAINEICMNLGAPREKIAGIHMHVDWGNKVKKGDKLFTLYAPSSERLQLGVAAARKNKAVFIK
ncbi:MAG: AMP phosphorylase [Patescibacteria group bacterium]